MAQPEIYFIIGTPNSGRDQLWTQFLNESLTIGETVLLLSSSETEKIFIEGTLSTIPMAASITCNLWNPEALKAPEDYSLIDYTVVIFILDPVQTPIKALEALHIWSRKYQLLINRILTCVECTLLQAHNPLFVWIEACIHFSDNVFLQTTKHTDKQWLESFQEYFSKACYPCYFHRLDEPKSYNLLELRYPEARRMSFAFDLDPYEPEATDIYFEKNSSGNYLKYLPDIVSFLK